MQYDQLDSELGSIDLTAMILVNMKNDSTPPASPTASPTLSMRSASPCPTPKELCDCMLCTRTTPLILTKCHTWAWIMRVVFYSLRDRYPEKKFFSLKNDVYEYMMNHWGALGLDRKPSANWHKQIQDMLSHSRNIFESGMTHFKQNGFWRLKDLEDPWTARPDTPRPPSTTPPHTPTLPSSPRKRGWKNEEEIEEEVVKKLCTPPTSPRLSLLSLSSTPESSPSQPSSPIASPLPQLKSSDELEKEVAILREQLHSMTESIAQLSTDALIPDDSAAPPSPPSSLPNSQSNTKQTTDQPQPHFAAFSHNRVWEESYPSSFPTQTTHHQQIGSVQA